MVVLLGVLIFQIFFDRHPGGANLEACPSLDPDHGYGCGPWRGCAWHRYERCLKIGMLPVPAKADSRPKVPAGKNLSPMRSPSGIALFLCLRYYS